MKHEKYRVLNLISRIDLTNANPKKRAVIKLLKWKPEARGIQFTVCHCRRRAVMVSYTLPDLKPPQRENPRLDEEDCGYSCGGCDFGNAGSRPVWTRKARG